MSEDTDLLSALTAVVGGESADALADRLTDADPETTKACANRLRSVAADNPAAVETVRPAVEVLLTADDRSVRLTVTKTVSTFAATEPEEATPLASSLLDRLDDDFYFVRGRAAEAVGHLALANPDAIETTTVIARLLNALSLDRDETRRHVTGALARVALGNPKALRTVTDDIADHLGDDDTVVQYYLTTALVAVATEYPRYCRSVTDTVGAQLSDDSEYVRGRAAEILALVTTVDSTAVTDHTTRLDQCTDDKPFVAKRAQFALEVVESETTRPPDNIGDCKTIGAKTTGIVEEITTPDEEGCPHCGEDVGNGVAPFCPACGMPF